MKAMLLCFLLCVAPTSSVRRLPHPTSVPENVDENLEAYNFQKFRTQFQRDYVEGTEEFNKREKIFHKKLKLMVDVNNDPHTLWKAGPNNFMDMTKDEFEKMLGYKKTTKSLVASFLENSTDHEMKEMELPLSHDWRKKMFRSTAFFQDQGACGSCWATAAVSALEGHLEINHGATSQLSTQFLVSCVPNPRKCGGTGGCQGATGELALEYIQHHGIPSAATWPYTSNIGHNGRCDQSKSKMIHARVDGFKVLPENKGRPLLQALYQAGPVVVSVGASQWDSYRSGIFTGCEKNAIINHAVVAVGFGEQEINSVKHKYYLLRNSWGRGWGEDGHMRLQRFDDDEAHCGVDDQPLQGTGCVGGPPQVRVCGMCGVLYDSTYPVGARFATPEEKAIASSSSMVELQ